MPLESKDLQQKLQEMISSTIHDWPTPQVERVSYQSAGVCLIFGPVERVSTALNSLPAGLKAITFSNQTPEPYDSRLNYVGEIVKIEGHLGTYRAQVMAAGLALDIGSLSINKNGLYDLILDLNDTPLLQQEVLPPGYEHFGHNSAQDIARILDKLALQTGTLYKPRYYFYNESICAHERQNITGCSRCLENCPAAAIQISNEHQIEINSYLCQGCGTCTQSCPGGALSYSYPDRKTMLLRSRQLLESFSLLSQEPANILFYEDSLKENNHLPALLQEIPANVLPFPVHSIAATGMEIWLTLLTSGAASVYLLHPAITTDTVNSSLLNEVQSAQTFLLSFGIEAERIKIINAIELQTLDSQKFQSLPIVNNNNDWTNDKRALLIQALEYLLVISGKKEITCSPNEKCGLGDLKLDKSRCTLCQSCVHLCPMSALSGDTSQLNFKQTACIQCGICVDSCPEHALKLNTVFHFDNGHASRVLFESKNRARCIHCGKAFAEQRLVDKSIELLEKLPSFQSKQVDLLHMCSDCRQQEAMKQ